MKVIIAGTRTITNYKTLLKAIEASGFAITTIISGGAPGVDAMGRAYAHQHGIPLIKKEARWNDINTKGAIIKTNKYGKKYNARAGFDRNEEVTTPTE